MSGLKDIKDWSLSDQIYCILLIFTIVLFFIAMACAIVCGIVSSATHRDLYYEIDDMYVTTQGNCISIAEYQYNALRGAHVAERYLIYVTDEQFLLFSVGDKVIYRDGGILLMEGGSFV